jgi:hypothetical protein
MLYSGDCANAYGVHSIPANLFFTKTIHQQNKADQGYDVK